MSPRKGWVEVGIGVLSLLMLFFGAQAAAGAPLAAAAVMVCGIAALGLFAAFAPRLLRLSKGNPKLRLVWISVGFVAVLVLGAAVLVGAEEPLTALLGEKRMDEIVKVFVFGVTGVFVLLFGNEAPKVPFNRYMGLRLPWTVTDEAAWRAAHRLLGALAWPCGLAQLAIALWLPAALIERNKQAVWLFLLPALVWLLVPSVYSLWLFGRRWNVGPGWLYGRGRKGGRNKL